MKIFRQDEGVSLIVATLMSAVFMLAIAGLASAMIQLTRERADSNQSAMTENLADSVVNFAMSEAGDKIGANIKSEDLDENAMTGFKIDEWAGIENCADIDPDSSVVKPCLGFRVIGRTADDALLILPSAGIYKPTYYSVPAAYYDSAEKKIKGTGSAAEECGDPGNADDPCYWNKISVDGIVEIPLYYEDDDGKVVVLSFVGTTQFKLRVRAPCKDYEKGVTDCKADERIELYPEVVTEKEYNSKMKNYPYADIKKDPVLLQWIISDLAGVKNESLLAKEDLYAKYKKRPYPKSDDFTDEGFFVGQNTEISGGRINDAANYPANSELILKNFTILESYHKGQDLDSSAEDPKIGDFIVDLGKKLAGIDTEPKPTLRLNLIGQPRQRKPFDVTSGSDTDPDSNFLNDTTLFVPYLEYQILTTSYSIADNKKTFFSWAQIGDFYKGSKGYKALPTTEGGLTLGNM